MERLTDGRKKEAHDRVFTLRCHGWVWTGKIGKLHTKNAEG